MGGYPHRNQGNKQHIKECPMSRWLINDREFDSEDAIEKAFNHPLRRKDGSIHGPPVHTGIHFIQNLDTGRIYFKRRYKFEVKKIGKEPRFFYRRNDAAKYAKCNPDTLRAWIKRGRVSSYNKELEYVKRVKHPTQFLVNGYKWFHSEQEFADEYNIKLLSTIIGWVDGWRIPYPEHGINSIIDFDTGNVLFERKYTVFVTMNDGIEIPFYTRTTCGEHFGVTTECVWYWLHGHTIGEKHNIKSIREEK